LFGEAKLSFFLSPMHRDIASGALDVPLPRPLIVPPYIDTTQFRPLGLERDLDVLYVGTISEAKGYGNLLEAFGPDRLSFAGPNALGEPVRGNYLGPMAYERLPHLYNRAKIFAHLPQWHEPMGRTVVEAALCGCEFVTNDRVGAMSFDRAFISDPTVVGAARERFWSEFEQAVGDVF
jgi:glycosyltransferase involved in cell wall biosynthesis